MKEAKKRQHRPLYRIVSQLEEGDISEPILRSEMSPNIYVSLVMIDENHVQVIRDAIDGLDFVSGAKETVNADGLNFSGQLQLDDGKIFDFNVLFTSNFPYELPVFKILKKDRIIIPHVNSYGNVCYANSVNVLLDVSRVKEIVGDIFFKVRTLLIAGTRGETIEDIWSEMDAYWGGVTVVQSFLENLDRCGVIYCVWGNAKTGLRSVSNSKSLDTQNSEKKIVSETRGIYVPIDVSDDSLIELLRDNEFVLNVLKSYEDSDVESAYLNTLDESDYVVIFGVKNSRGSRTPLGLIIRTNNRTRLGRKRLKTLLESTQNYCAYRFYVKRRDAKFIIERGGGFPELQNKKALLVGCGAVGSVVAEHLCRLGIGGLVLLDKDTFDADNIHRHILGEFSIGLAKSVAIKNDFSKKYPFVKIDAKASNAHDYIENILSENYDLIISATGDPNFDLRLNELARQVTKKVPVLFTWLEPLGIGGHALLTSNKSSVGCLACLFDEEWHNRASFVAPGQSFVKQLSGCAASFVPYGATAATRTACLAADLAADFLRGMVDGYPLLSWKGNERDFIAHGYQLSQRFTLTQDEMNKRSNQYKNKECRICSSISDSSNDE